MCEPFRLCLPVLGVELTRGRSAEPCMAADARVEASAGDDSYSKIFDIFIYLISGLLDMQA